MRIYTEKKAQTSIEVLLLIGGAIVLAAMVGMYLKRAAEGAMEGPIAQGKDIIGGN